MILYRSLAICAVYLFASQHTYVLPSTLGPPSQSLAVDPVDPDVMRRPARKKNASIITRRLMLRVFFSALIIVIGTLFVYSYALSEDPHMSKREQTMVSAPESLSSFFLLFLCRPPTSVLFALLG